MKSLRYILLLFFFAPVSAYTADFFFSPSFEHAQDKSKVTVRILLNTEGEMINTIAGELVIPPLLGAPTISERGSVIPFWITSPQIGQEKTIEFRGLIPGGIIHPRAPLFSLEFFIPNSSLSLISQSPFTIADPVVLLNDGKGSEVKTTVTPLTLSSTEKIEESKENTIQKDTEPPFFLQVPHVLRDPRIEENKWVLIFFASDKESGIDHYEVWEAPDDSEMQTNWEKALSPYLLRDQTRTSLIWVKAVDREGNETIVQISPKSASPPYTKFIIWGILMILSALAIITGIFVWKRSRVNTKSSS